MESGNGGEEDLPPPPSLGWRQPAAMTTNANDNGNESREMDADAIANGKSKQEQEKKQELEREEENGDEEELMMDLPPPPPLGWGTGADSTSNNGEGDDGAAEDMEDMDLPPLPGMKWKGGGGGALEDASDLSDALPAPPPLGWKNAGSTQQEDEEDLPAPPAKFSWSTNGGSKDSNDPGTGLPDNLEDELPPPTGNFQWKQDANSEKKLIVPSTEESAVAAAKVQWSARFSHKLEKMKDANGFKILNGYKVLGDLGEGAYGKVKLCCRGGGGSSSGESMFAMKVYAKSALRKKKFMARGISALDKVRKEIDILRHLYHRNTMLLFEVIDDDGVDKLYLITEYLSGGESMTWDPASSTFSRHSTGRVFPEELAKVYFCDVLSGLRYIHDLKIAHRDIKPENLLISAEGRCVICDFGVAQRYEENDVLVRDTEGTFAFFSPEMVGGDGNFSPFIADLWAVAVTLHCFVYGTLPFWDPTDSILFELIASHPLELSTHARQEFPAPSEELLQLLRRMMHKEAEKRPGIDEIIESDWIGNLLSDREMRADAIATAVNDASSAESPGRLHLRKVASGSSAEFVHGLGLRCSWMGGSGNDTPTNSAFLASACRDIRSHADGQSETGRIVIDFAPVGGQSEAAAGACISSFEDPKSLFITTTLPCASSSDFSAENLLSRVMKSKRKLGRIDLLYIHLESDTLDAFRACRVLESFKQMQKSRLVSLFGISVSDERALETACITSLVKDFDALLLPRNLFLSRPDLITGLQQDGMLVVVHSPVSSLKGNATPHQSIAGLMFHGADVVLTGSRHHVAENAAAAAI